MKYFTIKQGKESRVIQIDALSAVEVEDYICEFHIINEPSIYSVQSLREILLVLPDHFVKVSRNRIVNMLHVKSIDYNIRKLTLSCGKFFFFSVRNIKVLKSIFDRYPKF